MADETATEAPRIPASEMGRLLELVKGSDSVELKLTIPAPDQRATIGRLPMDPVEAQPRQVFFFETPDLRLNEVGIVVRARRRQGGRGDTVVKLRPVVPAELPSAVRRSAAFNVEVDAMPGGFVCSGSMKGRVTGQEVRDAITGTIPLRDIFTKEQRAFFRAHAPAGIGFEDLVPLGPTFILKAVFTPKALGRPLVAEMWLYPDGSRILELSTKCLPEEAFQVAAEARAYLASRGVPGAGLQQTKTKTALEFYAAELRQREAPPTPPARRPRTTRTAAPKPTAPRAAAPKPSAPQAAAAKPSAPKAAAPKAAAPKPSTPRAAAPKPNAPSRPRAPRA